VHVSGLWQKFSLATRFTLVAAIVVGLTMAVLARWVSDRIEHAVIRNTAASAALYMDRFVEPYVQELATGTALKPESHAALSRIMQTDAFSQAIIGVKIWRLDGTIAYSNDARLIGKQMQISPALQKAIDGAVASEFDHLGDEENTWERALGKPLLEIYSPVRQTNTAQIIAVAEFYQIADALAKELVWARSEGILMVAGLSLIMLGALVGIVRQGSSTIVAQERRLTIKIGDLSRSLALNRDLRQRVAEANRRATESSERFLRRVSADLHDGPVQLIGLALLRLDGLRALAHAEDKSRVGETLEVIRGALRDALGEIRGLAHDFALPELEELSLAETIDLAVSNHERRSGTTVDVSHAEPIPTIPASIKICAFRFVQEGLNNAFRHADGKGQRVRTSWDGVRLLIEVSDDGPGLSDTLPSGKGGIGLSGLRDRIESLGGTMLAAKSISGGALLQAGFVLKDG
jgi:signal transduction histidine kinase